MAEILNWLMAMQVQGITDLGLRARPPKKVGVIGGGLMGSGIATACILSGIEVVLKEINADFLQSGLDRVKGMNDLIILS